MNILTGKPKEASCVTKTVEICGDLLGLAASCYTCMIIIIYFIFCEVPHSDREQMVVLFRA